MPRLFGCFSASRTKGNAIAPETIADQERQPSMTVATVDKTPTISSTSMALSSPNHSNPISANLCYGVKVDPLHLEGRLPPIKTANPPTTPPPFTKPKQVLNFTPPPQAAAPQGGGLTGSKYADIAEEMPARFTVVRDIGVGMYGVVVLAFDSLIGEYVAIKIMHRGRGLSKITEREIFSHRTCSAHPHVIAFQQVFLTRRFICIVMEYAAGGDLFEYAKQNGGVLLEDEARCLFQQLVSVVHFCHRAGVVNRDIKLENTLLCTGREYPIVKLCDFGYSKSELMDSQCKTAAGTLEYVAPETLLNKCTYDGKAVDVWSCGIVLYVMLQGRYPFHKRPGDAMAFQRMLRGELSFKVPVSGACEDLIRGMLVVDTDARLTMEQVLNHPWVTQSLPEELARLNKTMPPPRQFVQSDEHVRAIVAAAQRPAL